LAGSSAERGLSFTLGKVFRKLLVGSHIQDILRLWGIGVGSGAQLPLVVGPCTAPHLVSDWAKSAALPHRPERLVASLTAGSGTVVFEHQVEPSGMSVERSGLRPAPAPTSHHFGSNQPSDTLLHLDLVESDAV
jgi:hypothetical protein